MYEQTIYFPVNEHFNYTFFLNKQDQHKTSLYVSVGQYGESKNT